MDQVDSQAAAPETGEAEAQATEQKETTEQVNWEAKAKELEAEAAKWKGIANRRANKADKGDKTEKSDKTDSEQRSTQSDGLDWGAKAYLRTEGIEATEFDFVEEQMELSGLGLEKLITNPYFKAQLQERRDQKSAEAAAPGKSRGSTESQKTKVDYWIERNDLPANTPENKKLRGDIIEARMKRSRGVHGL